MTLSERKQIVRYSATAEVFLPGGRPPGVGQVIVREAYARTLRRIADEGAETLYTGRLARVVVDDMQANGGLITLDHLANYPVCEKDPVPGQYRGYDILSAAPPSFRGP